MTKWSKEQERAYQASKGNYLISAGAGSGKTAVLTERVYYLVKQGYSISRFLILTFTKAASQEMKLRIQKKLSSDKDTKSVALQTQNAHIETFDAFSSFLVRKYALQLGISPSFDNLNEGLASLKCKRLIQESFDILYQKQDKTFLSMVSDCCVKNDDNLKDLVFRIISLASKQISPNDFYDNLIDKFFSEEYVEQRINQQLETAKNIVSVILTNVDSLEDVDDVNKIHSELEQFLNIKNYDIFNELILKTPFPTKPKSATSDTDFRTSLKKEYDNLRNNFKYGDSKTIKQQYLNSHAYVEILVDIAKDVMDKLLEYKHSVNAYCFSDIAQFAIQVLENPIIRQEMKKSFDFIMVDEYQDTNDIQEKVIQLIGNNNIYMVGDIKQSIYRFRDANCGLFNKKYEDYSKNNGGTLINLNTSYRSRKEVVNMVNDIFSFLMKKEYNPIDYKNGHIFKFGLEQYNTLEDDKEDYSLKVYRYSLDENENKLDKEISIVIDDIIYKINKKYQVYDKETGKLRDCKYKDFAIIMDRGTHFDSYRRAFAKKGVPLNVVDNEKIKGTDIVYVLKNLVRLYYYSLKKDFNNPVYQHSFVSVSRSFLLENKDQDILTIVKNKLYPHTELQKKIFNIIDHTKSSSLKNLIINLFTEFDLYYKIMKIRNFKNNCQKAESFISLAETMDHLGFSLEDFVAYFDELEQEEEDIQIEGHISDVNCVTLINIHKSKGLEFPIVYFPGLYKNFNRRDNNTSFIINKNFGVLLPYKEDGDNTSLMNHLFKEAEIYSDFEEKLRLFYVALTRVRERAIILLESSEYKHIPFLKKAKNMAQLLIQGDFQYKYGIDYKMHNLEIEGKIADDIDRKLEIKEINVPYQKLEKKRAGKDSDGQIDESLLEFGTTLHYLLEVVDYETKDTSFIKDKRLKKYVENVINSNLFKDVKNDDIYHEYDFFDETHNVHGVIDCLVKRKDYIDIIDFKLKNIDDEKYELQLLTYRDYIKSITNAPIKMHLISSITGEVKEIV